MKNRDVRILLVEDDIVDAEGVVRALRQKGITNTCLVATDGVEALDIVRGENGKNRPPWPYLILLDINLPRMNGLEFLRILRDDKELKRSVVFILTTSNHHEDRLTAYNNQVAGYLLKSKLGSFADVAELLSLYWRIVEFPPLM